MEYIAQRNFLRRGYKENVDNLFADKEIYAEDYIHARILIPRHGGGHTTSHEFLTWDGTGSEAWMRHIKTPVTDPQRSNKDLESIDCQALEDKESEKEFLREVDEEVTRLATKHCDREDEENCAIEDEGDSRNASRCIQCLDRDDSSDSSDCSDSSESDSEDEGDTLYSIVDKAQNSESQQQSSQKSTPQHMRPVNINTDDSFKSSDSSDSDDYDDEEYETIYSLVAKAQNSENKLQSCLNYSQYIKPYNGYNCKDNSDNGHEIISSVINKAQDSEAPKQTQDKYTQYIQPLEGENSDDSDSDDEDTLYSMVEKAEYSERAQQQQNESESSSIYDHDFDNHEISATDGQIQAHRIELSEQLFTTAHFNVFQTVNETLEAVEYDIMCRNVRRLGDKGTFFEYCPKKKVYECAGFDYKYDQRDPNAGPHPWGWGPNKSCSWVRKLIRSHLVKDEIRVHSLIGRGAFGRKVPYLFLTDMDSGEQFKLVETTKALHRDHTNMVRKRDSSQGRMHWEQERRLRTEFYSIPDNLGKQYIDSVARCWWKKTQQEADDKFLQNHGVDCRIEREARIELYANWRNQQEQNVLLRLQEDMQQTTTSVAAQIRQVAEVERIQKEKKKLVADTKVKSESRIARLESHARKIYSTVHQQKRDEKKRQDEIMAQYLQQDEECDAKVRESRLQSLTRRMLACLWVRANEDNNLENLTLMAPLSFSSLVEEDHADALDQMQNLKKMAQRAAETAMEGDVELDEKWWRMELRVVSRIERSMYGWEIKFRYPMLKRTENTDDDE